MLANSALFGHIRSGTTGPLWWPGKVKNRNEIAERTMKQLEYFEKKKIAESLADIPIFSRLSNEEMRYVARHMHVFSLEEGDKIFEEGEIGNCICFVVEGVLDVIKTSQTGISVVIAALAKGNTIGEMAVIDDFPRSATVKARTKAMLIIFTREEFEFILEQNPRLGIKLLKGISRSLSIHLRRTSDKLSDLMLPLYVH
jgi:CRP-like cAMP-binding protein